MGKIDVIIPVFRVSMETIRTKLLPICHAAPSNAEISIYAYCPAPEKSYVPATEKFIDIMAEYESSVEQWLENLNRALGSYVSSENCVIVREKDIARRWSASSHETEVSLLVVMLGDRNLLPLYRTIIRSTDVPVLVIFDKPWHKPITIVAAIDPFHERDEDSERDVRVVKACKEIARHVNGTVSLLHCCKVPVYLAEYKKKVHNYREQSVEIFAEDSGFGSLNRSVVNGLPVEGIRKFIADRNADILGMGSVSRGLWERYIMGGTADELLSDPPCDLLLLRK